MLREPIRRVPRSGYARITIGTVFFKTMTLMMDLEKGCFTSINVSPLSRTCKCSLVPSHPHGNVCCRPFQFLPFGHWYRVDQPFLVA